MRSSNPTLRDSTFGSAEVIPGSGPMTLQGTIQKSFILLVIAITFAAISWRLSGSIGGLLIPVGAFGGFITAMILCFKKTWAPALAPTYAVLEGLFLGSISAFYERAYGGIVGQAVMLTFGTFFALLAAYQARLIRPSENFKLGLFAATGGIALVYLATMLLGIFGIQIPYIHGSGLIGIGFSVLVVTIAALNLVLDFDFIEQGAEQRAPKYMEWYGAFSLLVTLVWLYIEFLRLLSKLRQR